MLSAEEYGQCTTVNDLTRVIQNHLNGGTEEKTEEGGPVAPITRLRTRRNIRPLPNGSRR